MSPDIRSSHLAELIQERLEGFQNNFVSLQGPYRVPTGSRTTERVERDIEQSLSVHSAKVTTVWTLRVLVMNRLMRLTLRSVVS